MNIVAAVICLQQGKKVFSPRGTNGKYGLTPFATTPCHIGIAENP